jgi:uncharacterized protein YqfB (UPF0267 family)
MSTKNYNSLFSSCERSQMRNKAKRAGYKFPLEIREDESNWSKQKIMIINEDTLTELYDNAKLTSSSKLHSDGVTRTYAYQKKRNLKKIKEWIERISNAE